MIWTMPFVATWSPFIRVAPHADITEGCQKLKQSDICEIKNRKSTCVWLLFVFVSTPYGLTEL